MWFPKVAMLAQKPSVFRYCSEWERSDEVIVTLGFTGSSQEIPRHRECVCSKG